MISSESINFSKYSQINNQNNKNLTTDIDSVNQKKENKSKDEKELSQMLLLPNEEIKPETEKENESNEYNQQKELEQSTENSEEEPTKSLLYGNPIDSLNPKYLGKCYAFLYDSKGNPKLIIGPDCK